MKKILLTILVFMLLAVPVTAETSYQLIVDAKLVDKPVVIINNLSYVPIRAIADIFGATTEWDGTTKTITIKTGEKEVKRPPIDGDAEFISKINAALDLLEQKDFPHYVMVCENTESINQTKEKPDVLPDNCISAASSLGDTHIYPLLTENPDQYTPVFLAGILTHEACHLTNRNYERERPESEAYAHELTVYNLLNSPQWMKDHCLNR